MHETEGDLSDLQRLLDQSYATAGEHLKSIFVPELASTAEEIADALSGIFVINLAVVTAKGEPLVAPVDGLFYRGRLWFGLPPRSQRVRIIQARPAVSATHMEGELPSGRCLIIHGVAEQVTYGHPFWAGYGEYACPLYGLPIPDVTKDPNEGRSPKDFTGFIKPRRIYAQGYKS